MFDDNEQAREFVARLMRWVFILFFGYMFFIHLPQLQSSFSSNKTPPVATATNAPAAAPKPAEAKKDCTQNIFNDFSAFSVPLFPVSTPSVGITDLTEGTGALAHCGQHVSLRYTYTSRGGDIIFSNMEGKETTQNVPLGGREMLAGFERGVIGMKVGGLRDLVIPPILAFGGVKKIETLRDHTKFHFSGDTSIVNARASLLAVTPELPATEMPLRIVEQHMGDGAAVECGSSLSIQLALWKLDGTLLFSTEGKAPLTFTVGSSHMPFGVEEGVIGLTLGGSRTLIIPPGYLSPLFPSDDYLLKDVKLPSNEIVLAVVKMVSPPSPAKNASNAGADTTEKPTNH